MLAGQPPETVDRPWNLCRVSRSRREEALSVDLASEGDANVRGLSQRIFIEAC